MQLAVDRLVPAALGVATALMFSGIEIQLGLKLRPFDFLMLLVLVLTGLNATANGFRRREIYPFNIAAALYALYLFANAAFLNSVAAGLKESIQLFFFALFFTVFVQAIRTDEATARYVRVALWSLFALTLWNAGYHIGHGTWSGWKRLDEPKLSHSLFVVLLAVIGGTFDIRWRGWIPLLALSVLLMILSGERKGWVACGAAILAAELFVPPFGGFRAGRTLRQVLSLTVILCVTIVAAPHVPYLEKQLESSRDFAALVVTGPDGQAAVLDETTLSNRARIYGIEMAQEFYAAHPVFGVGLERYKTKVEALPIPETFKKGAHNEVLRIAAELGTVGLGLYALLYLVILARVVRLLSNRGRLSQMTIFRLRLGVAFLAYGAVANVFLGGGGVNLFLIVLPGALIYSNPLPSSDPEAVGRGPLTA